MPQFTLFTAIAMSGRGKPLRFLVMATTESEARMWIGKFLGNVGNPAIWSIGTGEAGLSGANGTEDETWVFDQNREQKWYCL